MLHRFLLLAILLLLPTALRATTATQNVAITVTAAASSCPISSTSSTDGCGTAPAAMLTGTPQLHSTSPVHDTLFGCAPTNTGGPGGQPGCTPTVRFGNNAAVYAVRPTWNVPGLDYHVGCILTTCVGAPAGAAVGKVPNSTNLTASCGSGASVSGNTVTISGNNCTLTGYDFCAASVAINMNGDSDVVSNSKVCQFNGLNNNWIITVNGTNATITQNECDGKMESGGSSENADACWGTATGAGGADTDTITYNYSHDLEAKNFYWSPGRNTTLTYRYNFTKDIAVSTGGDHGEEIFLSANNTPTITGEVGYNLSMPVSNTSRSTTDVTGIWNFGSPNCCSGDTHNVNQNAFNLDHAVFIIANIWTNGYPLAFGAGCDAGGCESPLPSGTNNLFVNNYIDPTGDSSLAYPACGNAGLTVCGLGAANTFSSVTGNINLTTNGACVPAYIGPGRVQGSSGSGGCQ